VIVEIVGDTSAIKDTQRLPPAYFRAGVTEYWLIDARREELLFVIHTRGENCFQPVPPDAEGYCCSAVMQRRYRLERGRNRHGRLTFDLREQPF
jgi:Uma2 family endonuclease